ncbi:MAG: CHAD domain-containing protein [Terracidiphilus sp.]|jgi:CHAD domain-containing protein
MNTGSFPSEAHLAVSLQPEWQLQINRWRELLASCLYKPNGKRIHDLSSFTLRLSVSLEYWLLMHLPDPVAARAYRCWNNEGKRLQQALQPVRDADVYLTRLAYLRAKLEESPGRESKLRPQCLREIDDLVIRLKRRRQSEIDKLAAVIEARSERLNRRSKEMEVALAPMMASMSGSTAQAALRKFAALADEFTGLDSSNLHTYRKRLRPVLCLAEMSASFDPLAGRMAVAFRRIHLAIGEWHDWQTLAKEASSVFPGSGKQDGLVPVLESFAEKSLRKALVFCSATKRSLVCAGSDRSSRQLNLILADQGCDQCDKPFPLGISNRRGFPEENVDRSLPTTSQHPV